MESDKRRPERQLYRPPASRMAKLNLAADKMNALPPAAAATPLLDSTKGHSNSKWSPTAESKSAENGTATHQTGQHTAKGPGMARPGRSFRSRGNAPPPPPSRSHSFQIGHFAPEQTVQGPPPNSYRSKGKSGKQVEYSGSTAFEPAYAGTYSNGHREFRNRTGGHSAGTKDKEYVSSKNYSVRAKWHDNDAYPTETATENGQKSRPLSTADTRPPTAFPEAHKDRSLEPSLPTSTVKPVDTAQQSTKKSTTAPPSKNAALIVEAKPRERTTNAPAAPVNPPVLPMSTMNKSNPLEIKAPQQSLPGERNISNSPLSPASNGSLSTTPKGGILRLNDESMKLLNQTLKNDSDKRRLNEEAGRAATGRVSPVNLDFNYARSLADKLDYLLSTSKQPLDHTDSLVEPLRQKLMKFYEQILLYDLKSSRSNNALQLIWQHCFYPFIGYYREQHKMSPVNVSQPQPQQQQPHQLQQLPEELAKRNLTLLTALVAEGTRFFETLTHKLRATYHFSYKSLIERRKHYDLNRSLFSHLQEITYYMKIIYIYLGDLTRYFQSVQSRPNFEQAKAYYMKAHMLVPKNSHACSQIAMICYYQKNHFDAIYYFIRSFETESNPDALNTAVPYTASTPCAVPSSSRHQHKQMLTIIFDDIRQGYDENLKKLKSEYQTAMARTKVARDRVLERQSRINRYFRIEYWVRPAGTISKCDMYNFYDLAAIASNEEDPDLLHFYRKHLLPTFAVRDLKKRFIYSFLMVHGMLNCRIGLDRFFDVANQMLLEFECLLHHRHTVGAETGAASESHSLSSVRLIQLLVVNIYTISNTITDEERHKNAAQYSFTHMNAYFIMSTMMVMILRRLIALFDVFRRKHAQFMEEFVSMNRKDSKPPPPRENKDDSKEVFEEDNANIEDLFELSKKSVKKCTNDPAKEASSSAECDLEMQDWKDFYQLLPCVKIWADWVISTKPRFPPQEMNDLKTSHQDENIWHVFAKFLSLLDQFKFYPVNFYCEVNEQLPLALSPPKSGNVKHEYELVQLPEDRCLEGFRMITNAPESSKYIKLPFIPEIAFTYMRIASIQLFGDYLCGMTTPYLRYSGRRGQFESQVDLDDIEGFPGLKLKAIQERTFHESLQRFIKLQEQLGIKESEIWKGDVSAELEAHGVPHEDEDEDLADEADAIEEMNKLEISSAERRKLLQYRMLCKQSLKHGRYFKMLEHLNEPKRRFIIKPRYVIFDTNCFINDLEAIKHFVKTAPFLVTIPLIVVHELEFMITRGQRITQEMSPNVGAFPDDDQAKADNRLVLARKAAEIVEFIKTAFAQNRSGVRAITSKGSLLDTIEFTEDANDPDAFNNDDLVLYSCTNLIKATSSGQTVNSMRQMLEEAGERVTDRDEYIYHDVVLVTDDLNLRLKAVCFDVPVKKLKQFLKWTRALYREQGQPPPPLPLKAHSPRPSH